MRLTGLNAFMAPWNTIAMSRQRCGRSGVLAAGEDVLAVQQHATGDARVGRQQPHQREAERRLAAPRLAHEAHALAAREREARALHRVQLAALPEVEPDVQILHLQHRRARSRLVLCARRRGPQPEAPHRDVAHAQARVERVLDRRAEHRQATTTIATAMPGGTIAHQAPTVIASRANAFSISRPHDVTLGSPRPRNAIAVSAKIA